MRVFRRGRCPRGRLRRLRPHSDPLRPLLADPRVVTVAEPETEATVGAAGQDGAPIGEFRLVNEGGEWKIDLATEPGEAD